jgi:hypothetical protein
MKAFRPVSVRGVPDLGDEDRPGEEDDDEAEEQKAEPQVLAGEIVVHQNRIGSRAMATKRSAR